MSYIGARDMLAVPLTRVHGYLTSQGLVLSDVLVGSLVAGLAAARGRYGIITLWLCLGLGHVAKAAAMQPPLYLLEYLLNARRRQQQRGTHTLFHRSAYAYGRTLLTPRFALTLVTWHSAWLALVVGFRLLVISVGLQ